MVQLTLSGNSTQPRVLLTSYKQRGFTYIGVLVILVVMMMVMGAASEVWHNVMKREKEQELLFIGHEFRTAISQYYVKFGNKYPPSLEALVETNDLSGKKAYFLRKLYLDPITGNTQWGVVVAKGAGLAGVYSLSEEKPLKVAGFPDADAAFESAEKYSDWKFVFVPRTPRAQGGTATVVNGVVRPQPRVK
jgi:type II secretory pathway pseudopilin PulG